jgi:hypothetical protein
VFGDYRFRVETYYKDMRDLIVEDPENKNQEADGEYEFIYDNRGIGYSEGIEFFLQKKRTADSRLDGWIGYTYAVTRRNDRSEDRPDWYYPEYDQRHTINAVVNYYLFRGSHHDLFLNASLEFHTGRTYEDFDIVGIPLKDETVYVENRNGDYKRYPDYFNLDLKLEWVSKFRHFDLHAFFELLNATASENVTAYYVPAYKEERRKQTEPGLLPLAGLQITF